MSIDSKSTAAQDDVVASVTTVLSIANQCAREQGVDIEQSLISITQQDEDFNQWRVNYGPRDFMNKRGGDVFVFVDASTKSVTQVLLGQ
jgi:hypothetical protein